MEHIWTKSTLGHGETMCKNCLITNREAAALHQFKCPGPSEPKLAKAVKDLIAAMEDK